MSEAFFTQVAYTVHVSFSDAGVADEWLRWLFPDHLRAVLAAGAADAEVVEVDGPQRTFEVRYHFASREALARFFDALTHAEGEAPAVRSVAKRLKASEAAGREYAASEAPFDRWFKNQVRTLTGIDPDTTPLGPPTECIFDSANRVG